MWCAARDGKCAGVGGGGSKGAGGCTEQSCDGRLDSALITRCTPSRPASPAGLQVRLLAAGPQQVRGLGPGLQAHHQARQRQPRPPECEPGAVAPLLPARVLSGMGWRRGGAARAAAEGPERKRQYVLKSARRCALRPKSPESADWAAALERRAGKRAAGGRPLCWPQPRGRAPGKTKLVWAVNPHGAGERSAAGAGGAGRRWWGKGARLPKEWADGHVDQCGQGALLRWGQGLQSHW